MHRFPPTVVAASLRVVFALLLLNGCCPPIRPQGDVRNPPNLLPMTAVVSAINSNNLRIPSLWASLNYSANIVEGGKSHSLVSDDGILLYMRPGFFRLNGKKEFIGTVFDMGTNDTEFWLEIVPGRNELLRGTFAQLARMDPGGLPVDPEAVGQVLAVEAINGNFLDQPVPVMTYEGASDSYVFEFSYQAPDHWWAQKRVWYDRLSLRPRRVVLYDVQGRPQLDAKLGNDVRVQLPDVPANQWPLVPGDFRLFFPDSGSRMEFSLKDVRLYKDMGHGRHIPNLGSFQVPDVSGTDIREHRLDDNHAQ